MRRKEHRGSQYEILSCWSLAFGVMAQRLA